MQDIKFIDLKSQRDKVIENIKNRFNAIFEHSQFILGPENSECEEQLSKFSETRFALTCSNGSDALLMALLALDHTAGDAVICPSFTFIATAEMIPFTGATPIFVDVDVDTFNISAESCQKGIELARELGLTPKSIIAVDLFGAPPNYKDLKDIASKNNMNLIGDSAQGFGCKYNNVRSTKYCDITTTSFFPAKPLGCYGDGGAVFTDCPELARRLKSIRVHGMGTDKYQNVRLGLNARMDTFQSAVIIEKLKIFDEEIEARNKISEFYRTSIENGISCPLIPEENTSTWAQYTLKLPEAAKRQDFCAYLNQAKIPTAIYYPIPLHKQKAYSNYPSVLDNYSASDLLSECVVSIPMHPYLRKDQLSYITSKINQYEFNK